MRLLAIVLLSVLSLPVPAFCLEPREVFLLTNKNVPASRAIAEHYCKVRNVPLENILAFDLPKDENISRGDYNRKLRNPLRAALKDKKDQARVLLGIYGVPLRVGKQWSSAKELQELAQLKPDLARLKSELKKAEVEINKLKGQIKKQSTEELKKSLQKEEREASGARNRIKTIEQRQRYLQHEQSEACVDSELMLLWWEDYELRRWQPNLLNFRVEDETRKQKPQTLMVSRLDGPSPAIARRLVDDAVEVEKKGLIGKVYVDARGFQYNREHFGYGGYDESLREMARLLKTKGKMNVVLDNKGPLFANGACPDAALYCGWYALADYRPCCKFNKGAVAYHIASAEAVTLRDPKARYWCPNMLKSGVAATLGPVAEPYTVGFPKPAEFFGFLATGKYTLVECYSKTQMMASWMTVLVGDPLYNPFKTSPRLEENLVQPSPAGSPYLFRFGPPTKK